MIFAFQNKTSDVLDCIYVCDTKPIMVKQKIITFCKHY